MVAISHLAIPSRSVTTLGLADALTLRGSAEQTWQEFCHGQIQRVRRCRIFVSSSDTKPGWTKCPVDPLDAFTSCVVPARRRVSIAIVVSDHCRVLHTAVSAHRRFWLWPPSCSFTVVSAHHRVHPLSCLPTIQNSDTMLDTTMFAPLCKHVDRIGHLISSGRHIFRVVAQEFVVHRNWHGTFFSRFGCYVASTQVRLHS